MAEGQAVSPLSLMVSFALVTLISGVFVAAGDTLVVTATTGICSGMRLGFVALPAAGAIPSPPPLLLDTGGVVDIVFFGVLDLDGGSLGDERGGL